MLGKLEKSVRGIGRSSSWTATAALALGDATAILAFVAVGLESHHVLTHWMGNLIRVSAPFLIGWFVVAPLSFAYNASHYRTPIAFLARSTLGWFTGTVFSLILRSTLFGESFNLVFSLVTMLFTGLFILGWRSVFTGVMSRLVWRQSKASSVEKVKDNMARARQAN